MTGNPGRAPRTVIAARSPSSVWVGGSRHVEHGSVGGRVSQHPFQLGQVVDRSEDGEAGELEQLGQACSEEGVVLGEDKAHGTSRVTIVGPPSGLDTLIVPSNAARRRTTPRIPLPAAGSAPPRPSSPTSTVSTPASWEAVIQACSARACFPVLARHSATAK